MRSSQRRVFISRVSREFDTLAEELRSLLEAVGEAGHTQVAFRQEPDADTTLAKLSGYIRESDVVLCLIGEFSGEGPPDASIDDPIHPAPLRQGNARTWRHLLPAGFGNLSYTQWEVILARFWKKPVFLYFGRGHTPDRTAPPDHDDPRQQQQFVAWLTSERGLDRDYFATTDGLAKLVLRDLWPRKLRHALWITAGVAAVAAAAIVLMPRPDVARVSQRLAAQSDSLAELTTKLDQVKLDRAAAGQDFRSLTREDLERLLAEKAEISVQELRRRIAAGTASPDPLERARALVLNGEFDAALKETASIERVRTAELVQILTLKAQAHEGKVQYQEALAERRRIVALTGRTEDPAGWSAAQHMVARSLSDLGREGEAEVILREVIDQRGRTVGRDHASTLRSRNNLAICLSSQGKSAAAEEEIRTTLAALRRVLGPEHPDSLQSWIALAMVLADQGRHAEAEAELRPGLAVQERALGPEHPDTLFARNNLAIVLGQQGKYDQEEKELRTLIPVMERVFGREHPHVLSARSNLATALVGQAKYSEGEAEGRAVVSARERILGPEHPDTLSSRENLAVALQNRGASVEAAVEFQSVFTLRERILGPEHPDTLLSRNNVAATLSQQGKHADAEAEYRSVVAVQTRVLGPEHPDTLRSRSNLAGALGKQKKLAEEEAEHRALLPLMERVFGPEHPTTLRNSYNLSVCLRARGNERMAAGEQGAAHECWREALALARKVRDAGERAFGKDHRFLPRFERHVTELEAKLSE